MFSEYFPIVMVSGIWLAIVVGIASLIGCLSKWLKLQWLKYLGLVLVALCVVAIVAIVVFGEIEHLFAALYLTVIFSVPLLMISLVAGLLWRQGQQRRLGWLKYSGLSLFPLLLVALVAFTGELAKEVRQTVEIPGYRVEFFEAGGIDIEYFRYFYVYRPDGQRAEFVIDNDTDRCLYLKVQPQDKRIYFQCFGESLADASFVDTDKQTVYSGWRKQEEAIADLEFKAPG
ncbi:hypothetical protein IQ266_12850 [filamentous cyanobacterium LEGE 11480]|uniref:Uncharacterized protein n=1 Tax=Romeriopsis navalis LEGE 11480 TaxID=2777977 RepID=A0A928Z4W3_9CYAN|nr:hypothetical protein [Romeriopsis navalis]MBE9030620.1 hypothetical protein [Romeriopsis navalis LEGE 11480]